MVKRITCKPEFCPNPACEFYHPEKAAESDWYRLHGRFNTKCRGSIQRFRCVACGKCCSTQTFSIHYWTHSTFEMLWLLQHLPTSSGLRQTSRYPEVSYRVIQNRIRRLARNCLAVMDALHASLELNEDVAMDGFESYTRSKYHPNNITTVVGSDSQFVYAAIHTLLQRKGRMSERQKAFRALIQQVWTPPPQGIRDDCKAMLGDLAPLLDGGARRRCPQRLFTDEHTAYPQALALVPSLKRDLNAGRLQHITVSSRAPRTQTNPLFPVNYLDRQLRANMAEFARRTIKAGREVNCQMERIAIFMVFHNFLTPHRIHDRVAMDFGYTHAAFAAIRDPEVVRMMERMPTHRHIWGHSKTKQEWIRRIWQHDYRNPPAVQVRDETLSIHSVALPPQGLPAHFLA